MSSSAKPLKDLSIVIPVYRAENTIGELVDRLQQDEFLKTMNWELILVNDFSPDKSFEIIKAKAQQYTNVLGLNLHKNSGQHSATLAGINEANGEVLITMDDDGEHPVHEIENLLQILHKEKVDIVFGVTASARKSFVRNFFSKLFKLMTRMFSDSYGNGSAFRFIRREVYVSLKNHNAPFVFIDEVLSWYTKNVIFYTVEYRSPTKGSTYRLSSLFKLYINIMFTYSSLPAQLLTNIGLLGSATSFVIGMYFLGKKLFFKAQLGFTSIAVSILFSASAILLGLGIIAQYIYRQNILMNKYPQYSIKERTDQ